MIIDHFCADALKPIQRRLLRLLKAQERTKSRPEPPDLWLVDR